MTGRALELKLALWLLGVSGEHDFFQVVSDEWFSFRKSVKWMVHVVFTGYFAGVSVSTNRSGTLFWALACVEFMLPLGSWPVGNIFLALLIFGVKSSKDYQYYLYGE